MSDNRQEARNRLRGNRRKQLIDRWLRGEEDENYEVVPTRTEGRFIVKQRKTPLKATDREAPSVLTPEGSSDGSDESQEASEGENQGNATKLAVKEEKPKQKQKKVNSKQPNETSMNIPTNPSTSGSVASTGTTDSISLQILEQLRLLGEENRRNNERKERRRETKAMVRKQLMKQSFRRSEGTRRESDDYSCETSDYERPPEIDEHKPAAPIYVRRRLNLLHRQG